MNYIRIAVVCVRMRVWVCACVRVYTHVSRTLYSGFVLPRKQPETPTPAHLLSRFRVTGLPWSVPTDLSLRHTPLYMAESARAGVGVLRPTDRATAMVRPSRLSPRSLHHNMNCHEVTLISSLSQVLLQLALGKYVDQPVSRLTTHTRLELNLS